MAGIDWGVIALKDDKLLPNNGKTIIQGAGGSVKIGNIIFDKFAAMNQKAFEHAYFDQSDIHGDFIYYNFDDMVYSGHSYPYKRVLNWLYNGVEFHTKRLDSGIYLTVFSINEGSTYHFYRILQGYDVSLDSCYNKAVIRDIQKFLGPANYHKLRLIR